MSGFFGAGAIQGGVVLGNVLGKGGFFGPIFAAPGGSVLNLTVSQDFIGADGNTGTGTPGSPGVLLTQLMTTQQKTHFEAGVYTTVNISGSGAPARGYWIVSGGGTPPAAGLGGAGVAGGDGFVIDDNSPNPVTFNFDLSILRLYGGGGCGADELRGAGNGGNALNIQNAGASVTVNVSLVNGVNSGRLFGGGGGGGSTGVFGSGGGGGAAGLRPGGNSAEGGTSGGVYDPVNGGVSNPNVLGGIGIGGGGNGGGLGADGTVGTLGTGGAAVLRNGFPGVTTITSGNDAAHVRGLVQ